MLDGAVIVWECTETASISRILYTKRKSSNSLALQVFAQQFALHGFLFVSSFRKVNSKLLQMDLILDHYVQCT